jgi:hypothetical protein
VEVAIVCQLCDQATSWRQVIQLAITVFEAQISRPDKIAKYAMGAIEAGYSLAAGG